jgi:Fic family protein
MKWNWQLKEWPAFSYSYQEIQTLERQFLLGLGSATAFLKNIPHEDYQQFIVQMLSQEGSESSKIEGEVLDRESLQSSIKRHFGLQDDKRRGGQKESGMAELLYDVYESFNEPLTHEMLWKWHAMLFKGQQHLDDKGRYRTHAEPMQIVSHRYDQPKVFFEAPPSETVFQEMSHFINWFNQTPTQLILGKAAVAHVYFESIHPFEDGNGRIGRVISEKILSQGVGRPILIAVSKILEQRKKDYYAALERCNKTLEITPWVEFFAEATVQAEEESTRLLNFLIEKSTMMTSVATKINPRQEKALIKMFESGPNGFTGGLSAENYIAMTKASRATATRDLADLVAIGALVRTGELRHTRYWLNIM